jgi:hypothetical protein
MITLSYMVSLFGRRVLSPNQKQKRGISTKTPRNHFCRSSTQYQISIRLRSDPPARGSSTLESTITQHGFERVSKANQVVSKPFRTCFRLRQFQRQNLFKTDNCRKAAKNVTKLKIKILTLPKPRTGCYTPLHSFIAGWSSPVARQAHNLKVVSSNLAPATK